MWNPIGTISSDLAEVKALLQEQNGLLRELVSALTGRAPLTARASRLAREPLKPKTGNDVMQMSRERLAELQREQAAEELRKNRPETPVV